MNPALWRRGGGGSLVWCLFILGYGLCFALTVKLEEMKRMLLGRICELGRELPLNTLDELIDRLGGPENVSEVRHPQYSGLPRCPLAFLADLWPPRIRQMTGRKGRVVRQANGSVRYESRAEQGLTIDHINIKEKERFMDGEKVGEGGAKPLLGGAVWF